VYAVHIKFPDYSLIFDWSGAINILISQIPTLAYTGGVGHNVDTH